jgi:hypothetical protein
MCCGMNVLRHECAAVDDQHIDAVKESTISTPTAPEMVTRSPFNRHITDPRIQARQMEWLETCSPRAMADRYEAQ